MDATFDSDRNELSLEADSNDERAIIGYGQHIERRRPTPARPVYVTIVALVASFTAAAALSSSATADDSSSAAAIQQPLASLSHCETLGLIEAPSVSPSPDGALPVENAPPQLGNVQSQPAEQASGTAGLTAAQTTALPDRTAVAPNISTQAEADQWGRPSLDLITYPWAERLPGWEITFHPPKKGLYGLTLVSEKRIEIYLREGETRELFAHVIAHEIGHAVDVTFNDGPDRRVWSDARAIESAPWWPGDGAADFETGAGDFAEAFAAWQIGSDHFRSKLAGPPTAAQVKILETLANVPRC